MYSMTQRLNRLILVAGAAIVLLGASGCTSNAVYPSDWPSIDASSSSTCLSSLVGEYHNAGEYGRTNGGSQRYSPPYLSSYFFVDKAEAARADRIRITEPADGVLRVELPGAAPAVSRIELRAGKDYRCEGGRLVIESSHFVAENVSGHESNAYYFARAQDSSLVVQIDSSAVGLVLVIPVAGSSTEWQRFLPAD